MFATSVQPEIVSLFSSSGSQPLGLFSTHTDSSLSSDSIIHLLNDTSSYPPPPSPTVIVSPPPLEQNVKSESDTTGYSLDQTVLHIQSPTLPTTYIRCPPASERSCLRAGRGPDLGIKHPWMHIQIRDMGREWSFEVGLVDQSKRLGVVRCSTFQVLVSFL